MSATETPPGKRSIEEPVSELRRVPIRDNGEPLVDFLELCPEIYWVPRHPVFDYQRFRLARRTVAEMLAAAARAVPSGLRLAVVEGWRPPEIQRRMHAATLERIRREHPQWTDRHVARVANRFSAPMDRRVPPPHTTGGAVDVHLVTADGEILDFQSPYGILDARAAVMEARGLSETALKNRRLLAEIMISAGFTNYPAEWWHWSYGDQGWAYRGGHLQAFYGAIEPQGAAEADFTFRVREKPGWEE